MDFFHKEQSRPKILFQIYEESQNFFVSVKNVGGSVAWNLKWLYPKDHPVMTGADENHLLDRLSFFREGFSAVAPNTEFTTLLTPAYTVIDTSSFPYKSRFEPCPISVTYFCAGEKEPQTDHYMIDFSLFAGTFVVPSNSDLIKDEARRIRDSIKDGCKEISKELKLRRKNDDVLIRQLVKKRNKKPCGVGNLRRVVVKR